MIIFPLLADAASPEVFHEITGPVDYSLVPRWVVFAASFAVLSLLGAIIWWWLRRPRSAVPPKLPGERALEALDLIAQRIEQMDPYRFSIEVSNILRSYVNEQYGLPVTKQTSVEFLERVARNPQFSPEEKTLLEDFLNRCDLIKFARYDATSADSTLLLEEATRFVKGGEGRSTKIQPPSTREAPNSKHQHLTTHASSSA